MDISKLQEVFKSFTGGAEEMDNRQFAKLFKDCGFVDKSLSITDVDLTFQKVKHNPHIRKINFQQFQEALDVLAAKRKVAKDDLATRIMEHGGPEYHGTKPDFVKFHDDKSTYTGV